MKINRLLIGLVLFYSATASAITCSDLFPNALGSRDRLEIHDRASLINTGNRILATDDLRLSRSDSCDGQRCIDSGHDADSVNITRPTTNTDLTSSRAFVPGDYFFDDVRLNNNDVLSVTGSGQVRIHIRDDLILEDRARVNVAGSPINLVFIVYDNATLRDDAQVNAIFYVRDDVDIRDDVVVQGALVGDRVRIRGDAEFTFSSPGGNKIDGLCDASTNPGPGPGPGPSPERLTFRMEVGALTVIDTYTKDEFTRVNFTQTFVDPPVVFTLPTTDGSNSAAHRIRNVTGEGFDIMTLEPDGEDGPHIAMSLNYLAIEKGNHTLPGGGKLRVGTVNTSSTQAYRQAGSWESISFGSDFSSPPAVLGQIQTMVNEQETRVPSRPSRPWLTTAINNVTAGAMDMALERSDSASGAVRVDETIGYMAVEPFGRMTFLDSNGSQIDMEVIRSDPVVQGWSTCNKSGNRVFFSQRWASTPIVLATKNTRDGDNGTGEGDGGWFRRCVTTRDYVGLAVDEVRSNRTGDRNRVHDTRERAGIVVVSDNFVTEARQLDHYRIEHDGFGVPGVAEDVTIRVCKNSDCSDLYTGTVTVTMTPGNSVTSWSGANVAGNQVTFSGGSRRLQLNRTAPGTINLGLSATPSAANALRCYVGAVQDCGITYVATNFDVVFPDQVSAIPSNGSVSLANCIGDLQSKQLMLSVVASYLDPSSIGPGVRVNGTSLPTDGSAAAVPFAFNANCEAPLEVLYDEAGQVGLTLTYAGGGYNIVGSDSAVFYPASLTVTAQNSSGTVLNATAADALPVHAAGENFELAITAVNAAGAVTRRYRPQAANRLLGYLRRTGPLGAGSVEGSLSVGPVTSLQSATSQPTDLGDFTDLAISPSDVNNGAYLYSAANYDEVGLITFDVTDSDYFGHQIDAVETPIGRFVPASFVAAPSLTNRSASGCSGANFTYLDEILSIAVDLTATNASGGVVHNYLGSFAKFDGAGFATYAGTPGNTLALQHGGSDRSARLLIDNLQVDSWISGLSRLQAEFSMQKGSSVDGPFDAAIVGLSIVDEDGVSLGPLDLDMNADATDDHQQVGTTNLHYGRLFAGNAHGSQLLDLSMPITAQYYAGTASGFVTQTDDDCSPLASVSLADADTADGLSVGETCIWDTSGLSGGFACTAAADATKDYLAEPVSGIYRLWLAAPGGDNAGGLDVIADAPDYLHFDWTGTGDSDPQATATFGIHRRDNRVIYQRELR